jgi:hypothetical protein
VKLIKKKDDYNNDDKGSDRIISQDINTQIPFLCIFPLENEDPLTTVYLREFDGLNSSHCVQEPELTALCKIFNSRSSVEAVT